MVHLICWEVRKMLLRLQNAKQGSSKTDELFIGAIAPNPTTPGFVTSKSTNSKPIFALIIPSIAIYSKIELQILPKICIGIKQVSIQEPCESSVKAAFSNQYYKKLQID